MNIDLRNVFILGDLFDQIKGGDLNMGTFSFRHKTLKCIQIKFNHPCFYVYFILTISSL